MKGETSCGSFVAPTLLLVILMYVQHIENAEQL